MYFDVTCDDKADIDADNSEAYIERLIATVPFFGG